MALKVRGVKKGIENLNALLGDIKSKKAVRAIQAATIIASIKAAEYTPVRTFFLLNSQQREIFVNGLKITGRIYYTAPYAKYVNDPMIKMDFSTAQAVNPQKEFLRKGVEDTEDARVVAILRELSL